MVFTATPAIRPGLIATTASSLGALSLQEPPSSLVDAPEAPDASHMPSDASSPDAPP